MRKLTESEKYTIKHEYEVVFLTIKESGKEINIGEFYGEPSKAIISEDEKECAMCGCGLTIYHLKEPFLEYSYDPQSKQWIDYGMDSDEEIWIDDMRFIDNSTIEITTEEGQKIVLSIEGNNLVEIDPNLR